MRIWKSQSFLDRKFPNGRDDIRRELQEVIAPAGISHYVVGTFNNDARPSYCSSIIRNTLPDLLTPLLEEGPKLGIEVRPMFLPFHWHATVDLGQDASEIGRRLYQPGGKVILEKNGVGRLCASWDENIETALRLLTDLLDNYDLKGLNLDALRYMHSQKWGARWICLCEACRARHKQYIGKEVLTDEDLANPGIAYSFVKHKNRQIRKLIEPLGELTRSRGVQKLALDARAWYFETAVTGGQEWADWAREGLVDQIVTMNYAAEGHVERLKQHLAVLAGTGAELYDGMGLKWSGGSMTTQEMVDLAKQAAQLGADGIKIFSAADLTAEQIAALAELSRL